MIQRWMGVRRAIKGIEVMIRDRLWHCELGAQSGLVCAVVTARAEPPVLLCVVKGDVPARRMTQASCGRFRRKKKS